MTSLLPMVVSNVLFAAGLALVALVVTRCWRSPQLAHALWALVLIKLITPPVAVYPLPDGWLDEGVEPAADGPLEGGDAISLVESPPPAIVPGDLTDTVVESVPPDLKPEPIAPSVTPAIEAVDTTEAKPSKGLWKQILTGVRSNWDQILLSIWGLGSLAYILASMHGIRQFKRLLSASVGAPDEVASASSRLARKLGLNRCPPIRVIEMPIPPLVWSLGIRPIVLLPSGLLKGLKEPQRDSVLAHELAHVRRRDDLVRWLEIVTLFIFWWNPLAWLARCKLREAEEECCDAWVVWMLPHERRDYGEALLKTIEFLTDRPVMRVTGGSTFGSAFYKRRIEMILKQNISRKMSWKASVLVATFAVCILPAAAQIRSNEEGNGVDKALRSAGEASGEQTTDSMSLPNQLDPQLVLGSIVDTQGRAIAGAKLFARFYGRHGLDRPKWGSECSTRNEGRFALSVPSAEKFEGKHVFGDFVWIRSTGHDLKVVSLKRDFLGQDEEPEITLAPQSSIQFVINGPDGNPIKGALVEPWLYRGSLVPENIRNEFAVRSDREGKVRLTAVPRDQLKAVRVTTKEFGSQDFRLLDKTVSEHVLQLGKPGTLLVRLIGVHASKIKKANAGITDVKSFHADALVRTAGLDSNRQTNGLAKLRNGEFLFSKLAPGAGNLTIMVEPSLPFRPRIGHMPNERGRKVPLEVEIVSEQRTEVEIPIERALQIEGVVRETGTKVPIPDVFVSVRDGQNMSNAVYTDAKGKFKAFVLPDVGERISVQIVDLPNPFVVPGKPTFYFPIKLKVGMFKLDLPPIDVDRGRSLLGTLIDGKGQAVSGTKLSVSSSRNQRNYGQVITDRDGNFTFTQLPQRVPLTFTDEGKKRLDIVKEDPFTLRISKK